MTFHELLAAAHAGVKMNFSDALTLIRGGAHLQRSGWNGKGMWIQYIPAHKWQTDAIPDVIKSLPWIGMRTADNGFVPWLASQTDILADDWQLA